jgi:exopolysaccharide production protein ExoZ
MLVKESGGKLYALQALRGMAAILVVCSHSIITSIDKFGGDPNSGQFGHSLGSIGVRVFFLISGFVMIYCHEGDFGQPGSQRAFTLKRLIRIVPLYWITTLIYYVKLRTMRQEAGFLSLTLSLLFIPYQKVGDIFGMPLYVVGWTLQYEMFFYLIFAIALYFRTSFGIMLIVAAICSMICMQIGGLFGNQNTLSYLGQPITLYFVGGVLIGLVRRHGNIKYKWRPNSAGAFIFASGILILAAIILQRSDDAKFVEPGACLIAFSICAVASEGYSTDRFSTVAKYLGDATYSIYLTHSFILGFSGRIVGRLLPSLPLGCFIALMVPATVVVGLLTYRVVEKPIMGGLKRLTAGRRNQGRETIIKHV